MARGRDLIQFRRRAGAKRQFYYTRGMDLRPVTLSTSSFREPVAQDDDVPVTDSDETTQVPQGARTRCTLTGTFSNYSNALLGMSRVGLIDRITGVYINPLVYLAGAGVSNITDEIITSCVYDFIPPVNMVLGLRCALAVGTFRADAGLTLKVEFI